MLGKCRGADGAVVDLDKQCSCYRYNHQVPGVGPTIQVRRGCPLHCPDPPVMHIPEDAMESRSPESRDAIDRLVQRLASERADLLAALKALVVDVALSGREFDMPATGKARALIARLEGK